VVCNDYLRLRDDCHAAGETITDAEVQRRVITLAKHTPQRAWLSEVASVALVQACQDARRLTGTGTTRCPESAKAARSAIRCSAASTIASRSG
jgi:hypothetical protein